MTTTDTRSLQDVLSGYRFAQLVTAQAGTLTSRPLAVQETEGDAIRFLVDANAEWRAHVSDEPVLLSFADPARDAFASITGAALVSQDQELITRLFSASAQAFFAGPDDPRLRVLEVTATSGEWWDGPSGGAGHPVALLRAAVAHDDNRVGKAGSTDL